MKINSSSQLGLNITKEMVMNIISYQYNNFISACTKDVQIKALKNYYIDMFYEEVGAYHTDERINNLISDIRPSYMLVPKNKNYIMTAPALELVKRIKIDQDKFDVRFLSKIQDKKITFLLGDACAIRFVKTGSVIFAIRISTYMQNNSMYIKYTAFKIDTANGFISYDVNPECPLSDDNFIFFIQLLVFTELSELEIVILKPKTKTGTKRQGKYINESREDVVIVDSSWNKIMVREDGFSVRGHFRLQPVGVGFADRKLIYIDEFQKEGYTR